MSIALIDKEDVKYPKRKPASKISKDKKSKSEKPVKPIKSIKEIKDNVKNSNNQIYTDKSDKYYKTGSIKHNLDMYKGLNLNKFFWDYNKTLNKIIIDIWETIEWKEWIIEKENPLYQYSQKRLYPHYRKDGLFKSDIRDHYLNKYKGGWKYSAHWINSAIDVAFSIMDSWKKNYNKGKRKRNCPVAKRLFVRVKQTLMNIEKEMLRISIKPRQFIYIDISGEKRYFKINGKIGEPILTPTHIHLPIRQSDDIEKNKSGNNKDSIDDIQKIGWDLNKFSMDGFNPGFGWIRISLNKLHSTHMAYDKKRRRIQKLASTKKVVGKRLKEKYSKREKNRCNQIAYEIVNDINKIGLNNNEKTIRYIHKFEDLDKYGMFKKKKGKRGKKWNRELGYTNWKDITSKMGYKDDKGIEFVDPYHTSKDCSRCGCTNKDLNRVKFVCVNKDCGLTIDRQFNASINVYVKDEPNMEGLSQDSSLRQEWFDETILKEFTQTGAERKETNELARSLYDLMKPQIYRVIK